MTTFHPKNKDELADHLCKLGMEARKKMNKEKGRTHAYFFAMGEAMAFESSAVLLRKSKFEE